MRVAVGLIVLLSLIQAACDSSEPTSCAIWPVMERRMAGRSHVDCGSVQVSDEVALQQAHDCVVTALAAGESFYVIWSSWGIDAGIVDAYLSLDGVSVERISSNEDGARGDGLLHYTTSSWRCDSFRTIANCSSFQSEKLLCFECMMGDAFPTCTSSGPFSGG